MDVFTNVRNTSVPSHYSKVTSKKSRPETLHFTEAESKASPDRDDDSKDLNHDSEGSKDSKHRLETAFTSWTETKHKETRRRLNDSHF